MPFLQHGKNKIYYVIEPAKKKQEAEILILLHNNITDHTLFDEIVPYLNKAYTIVRYDLRGFGLSERGEQALSYSLYIEDLHFLVKSLRIKHFHLVGMGFSALVAAKYTAQYNKQVDKLILLSMACNPPHTIEKVRKHRKQLSHSGQTIPIDYILKMGTVLPHDHPLIKHWIKIVKRTSPELYANIMDLSISGYPLEDLKVFNTPTLILSGEEDILFPQGYLVSQVSQLSHCHYMSILGAASFIVLDNPKITAVLMLDFIERHHNPEPSIDPFVTSMYEEIQDYTSLVERKTKGQNIGLENLYVGVLHSFQVYLNQEEILEGWNQRFAKSILTYLILHRSTTREQLCEALWPQLPIRQSKKNLTVYLSYLKKLLMTKKTTQPLLSTDREHIHLTAQFSSDISETLNQLRSISNENDPKIKFEASQKLLNNLALPLAPTLYDDWFIQIVNQIEENLIQLALGMADWWLQEGKEKEAFQHLRKYFSLFHEDESIYNKMIELQVKVD
ncbi:pimeloyl-ACP methyl ester carboxylesterase/DNA-binding SARP family transcriptional activator [Pullulanibacillus pueri]|uniref:AB hydrolase-1 domain-containing protein n=1 Tax=Pullulanibacillus pueri TaxID=1437324 RepID=A0A8J2ZVY2_9BACL|nr:alpha/beta hydrolase [Pullulanibacillus pueri]MBM7682062.1 pimeloyl-ACP methyl ester carboxylesterase/DNA-binding SARP family transcriptional activator [Pullulanibacillus pueri]GGH80125.1 hypothetical protein GCM10007096_16070 [Pullulanibacillus pueri]